MFAKPGRAVRRQQQRRAARHIAGRLAGALVHAVLRARAPRPRSRVKALVQAVHGVRVIMAQYRLLTRHPPALAQHPGQPCDAHACRAGARAMPQCGSPGASSDLYGKLIASHERHPRYEAPAPRRRAARRVAQP